MAISPVNPHQYIPLQLLPQEVICYTIPILREIEVRQGRKSQFESFVQGWYVLTTQRVALVLPNGQVPQSCPLDPQTVIAVFDRRTTATGFLGESESQVVGDIEVSYGSKWRMILPAMPDPDGLREFIIKAIIEPQVWRQNAYR